MKKSKIILTRDEIRTEYDIIFTINSENYTYIAFRKINDKEKIYFGKVKENSNVFKNVTKKEEKDLILVMSKYTDDKE